MSGVVVLELEWDYVLDCDARTFVGRGYARGFTFTMPRETWWWLGEPGKIQFVASGEPLGVLSGWVGPLA